MAHELSTVKTGSGYAIVCIGDAWHGLQNAFTGDAQKDLAQAGLDFDVVKLPAFASIAGMAHCQRIDGRWSNRSERYIRLVSALRRMVIMVHQPSDIHGAIKPCSPIRKAGDCPLWAVSRAAQRYGWPRATSTTILSAGKRIIVMRLCQRHLTRHKASRCSRPMSTSFAITPSAPHGLVRIVS